VEVMEKEDISSRSETAPLDAAAAAWEAPMDGSTEAPPPLVASDDESQYDSILDNPNGHQEEPLVVSQETISTPEEKQPIATSANHGNWFKKWADKFIDLIDE